MLNLSNFKVSGGFTLQTLTTTGNILSILNSNGDITSVSPSSIITSGGGITGTGASGRLALWNGTSTQTSDAGLIYSGSKIGFGVSSINSNFQFESLTSGGFSGTATGSAGETGLVWKNNYGGSHNANYSSEIVEEQYIPSAGRYQRRLNFYVPTFNLVTGFSTRTKALSIDADNGNYSFTDFGAQGFYTTKTTGVSNVTILKGSNDTRDITLGFGAGTAVDGLNAGVNTGVLKISAVYSGNYTSYLKIDIPKGGNTAGLGEFTYVAAGHGNGEQWNFMPNIRVGIGFTGLYNSQTIGLDLNTGHSLRVRDFSTNGNVVTHDGSGIFQSTPISTLASTLNYWTLSGGDVLRSTGDVIIGSGSLFLANNQSIGFKDNLGGYKVIQTVDAFNTTLFRSAGGGLYFQNLASSNLLVMNENGNVGIGLSPTYKLHLQYSSATGAFPFAITNGSINTLALGGTATGDEGNLYLNAPAGQGPGAGIQFSSAGGVKNGLFQLDSGGNMVFRQSQASMYFDYYDKLFFSSNSGASIQAVLTNDGNLGIGEPYPNKNLVIKGTTNAYVALRSAAGSQALTEYVDGVSQKWSFGKNNDNGFILYDNIANRTVFNAESNGNLSIFPTTGNLAIGTANPEISAKLTVNGSTVGTDGTVNIYKNVLLGNNNIGTTTGTLKLKLPTSKRWSGTMFSMTVKGYNYSGPTGAWEVKLGGYNYEGGYWANTSAVLSPNCPFNSVRFGDDGTTNCILFGTVSTSWSISSVYVEEFSALVGDVVGWGSGWSISILTSETGVTSLSPDVNKTPWVIGGNNTGTTGVLGTLDNQDVRLVTNNAISMFLDKGGQIVIGAESTVDSSKLLVYGNTNSTLVSNVRNDNSGTTAYSMMALNAYGNSWGWRMGSQANNNNRLDLVVDAMGAASPIISAQLNGTIGIGTTTTPNKLNVLGQMSIGSATPEALADATINILGNTDTRSIRFGSNNYGIALQQPGDVNYLRFIKMDGGSAELVRIQGDGDVGIGTVAPTYRLHSVSSDFITASFEGDNNNGANIFLNSSTTAGQRQAGVYTFSAGGNKSLFFGQRQYASDTFTVQLRTGSFNASGTYDEILSVNPTQLSKTSTSNELYLKLDTSNSTNATTLQGRLGVRMFAQGYWTAFVEGRSYSANYIHGAVVIGAASNITSGVVEDRMYISGDTGNVGIGSGFGPNIADRPLAKFHVKASTTTSGRFESTGTDTEIMLGALGQGTDLKFWGIYNDGTTLKIRTLVDAISSATNIVTFNRAGNVTLNAYGAGVLTTDSIGSISAVASYTLHPTFEKYDTTSTPGTITLDLTSPDSGFDATVTIDTANGIDVTVLRNGVECRRVTGTPSGNEYKILTSTTIQVEYTSNPEWYRVRKL